MDTLPGRPAIPSRYTVIEVSAEELRLVSPSGSLSIKSKSTEPNLLRQLTHLLRGDLSTPEIIDSLGDTWDEGQVRATLRQLQVAGALEDAAILEKSPLSDDELRRHRDQITFFTNFAGSTLSKESATARLWPDIPEHGVDYQQRLRNASVLVYGLGGSGSLIARDLVHAGVGHIAGIDEAPVSLEDAHSPAWYDQAHVGRSRADAMADLIASTNPTTTYTALPMAKDPVITLLSGLEDCTFAVLCTDHVDPGEYEAFNTACLKARVQWTSVRTSAFEVNIGPTIIPTITPCYTCYDLRRKSNLTDYEEYLVLEGHLRTHRSSQGALAVRFGIDLVVIEIIKSITQFVQPATIAHLFTLNILTMESSLHPVLKIPRCSDCGLPSRNSPPIQAWQRFEDE